MRGTWTSMAAAMCLLMPIVTAAGEAVPVPEPAPASELIFPASAQAIRMMAARVSREPAWQRIVLAGMHDPQAIVRIGCATVLGSQPELDEASRAALAAALEDAAGRMRLVAAWGLAGRAHDPRIAAILIDAGTSEINDTMAIDGLGRVAASSEPALRTLIAAEGVAQPAINISGAADGAFTTAAREAGDISAGVFDMKGRMLAQAVTGTPGHINSMARSVVHFLDAFPAETLKDGDILITNDPWKGTGHLFDLTVVTPIFLDGRPVALFACTTHVVDIGGLGVSAEGRQIYHEGLYIPLMHLAREGRMNEDLLGIVRANVREPVQVVGDIYALVACNETGGKRLREMMREIDGYDSIIKMCAEFFANKKLQCKMDKK
jgi:hypothetical protein